MNIFNLKNKKGFDFAKNVIEEEFNISLKGDSFEEILNSSIPIRYKYNLLAEFCELSYNEYNKLIIDVSNIYINILNDTDRFELDYINNIIKSCHDRTIKYYTTGENSDDYQDLIKATRKIYDDSEHIRNFPQMGLFEENNFVFKTIPTNIAEYGLIALKISYMAGCINPVCDPSDRANYAIIDNIVKDVQFGKFTKILKEETFTQVLKSFFTKNSIPISDPLFDKKLMDAGSIIFFEELSINGGELEDKICETIKGKRLN